MQEMAMLCRSILKVFQKNWLIWLILHKPSTRLDEARVMNSIANEDVDFPKAAESDPFQKDGLPLKILANLRSLLLQNLYTLGVFHSPRPKIS